MYSFFAPKQSTKKQKEKNCTNKDSTSAARNLQLPQPSMLRAVNEDEELATGMR